MPDLDPPRLNLLKLVAEHSTDLSNVSQAIGRNHAYLHQYINRGSPRQLAERERDELSRYFKVSPDIFRQNASPLQRNASDLHDESSLNADHVRIPELEVAHNDGEGGVEGRVTRDSLNAVAYWSFPKSFLKAYAQKSGSLVIINVAGDSMTPDYQAGDRILVDQSLTLPTSPGVYVIWNGLGLVLKRLEVKLNHEGPLTLLVSGSNPAYRSYDCALSDIQIIGRVVGKWQWS